MPLMVLSARQLYPCFVPSRAVSPNCTKHLGHSLTWHCGSVHELTDNHVSKGWNKSRSWLQYTHTHVNKPYLLLNISFIVRIHCGLASFWAFLFQRIFLSWSPASAHTHVSKSHADSFIFWDHEGRAGYSATFIQSKKHVVPKKTSWCLKLWGAPGILSTCDLMERSSCPGRKMPLFLYNGIWVFFLMVDYEMGGCVWTNKPLLPSDHPWSIWWALRPLITGADGAQHPGPQPSSCLQQGRAERGGERCGHRALWAERRPLWEVLQLDQYDREGSAAAYWCKYSSSAGGTCVCSFILFFVFLRGTCFPV